MFSGEAFGHEVLGWMATIFIFAVGSHPLSYRCLYRRRYPDQAGDSQKLPHHRSLPLLF